MGNYLIFIYINKTVYYITWLGMTLLNNVIPCPVSRLSQKWLEKVILMAVGCSFSSVWHSDWMSYRLLAYGVHWYDIIMSYRVLIPGIVVCVYDLCIYDIKMSYRSDQNGFWVLCHTEWLSGQVWKVIPCLCSMAFLIYVIPFLF